MKPTFVFAWTHRMRLATVMMVIMVVLGIIMGRVVQLSVVNRNFLMQQANERSIRWVTIPAERGALQDRHGLWLATNEPAHSIWMNPQHIAWHRLHEYRAMCAYFDIPYGEFLEKSKNHIDKKFVYLKRQSIIKADKWLALPGIVDEPTYRRWYAEADTMAAVLGTVNVDNQGQEGLEWSLQAILSSRSGKQHVIKDAKGNILSVLSYEKAVKGHDVRLSLDARIQRLAYDRLQAAVSEHHLEQASVIMVAVHTGQILAMVNYPSWDPNKAHAHYRNMAVTDLFEPGSVMKTFAMINALEDGPYTPFTLVDTNPGIRYIDQQHMVKDPRNYGILTLSGILEKSSNVGISTMMLTLKHSTLPMVLKRFGFGQKTGSHFPGEVSGWLPTHRLSDFERCVLSFGYTMMATPLQLVRAYAAIANGGWLYPMTFTLQPNVAKRVLSESLAKTMQLLLFNVVTQGSGRAAQTARYTVGGKTGTARMVVNGHYDNTKHVVFFVGFAPIHHPVLAMIVALKNPDKSNASGGSLAAPIFSDIMQKSLMYLNVPFDR
jgi:cell division protein FtsI (penicillin-binding protein 3)